MNIVFSDSAPTVRGVTTAEEIAISALPLNVAVGGVSGQSQIHEFSATVTTNASVNYGFTVQAVSPALKGAVSLSVAPGSEGKIEISGMDVRALGSGTAGVIVKGPTGQHLFEHTIGISGGGSVATGPVSYATGSLMKHLNDRASALCAAYPVPATFTEASDLMRQSVDYDGSPTATAIKSDNWLMRTAPGWSVWTEEQMASVFGGVVSGVTIATGWVHPNYRILPGGFSHGSSCSLASIAAGTCFDITGDSRLVYDTSTPAGKRYFNVMPSDWKTKLRAISDPGNNFWLGLPRLTTFARLTNHKLGGVYGKWLIVPLDLLTSGGRYRVPADPAIAPFCTNYYDGSIFKGGDSFSPVAIKINDTVVYLGSVSEAGGGGTAMIDAATINAAMASMSAKRGVAADTVPVERIVDLSAFNTYP
jgi:hypothetical protein